MATRADFTDEEWKTLQEGVTGAGMYVALVDRGFFDVLRTRLRWAGQPPYEGPGA